MRIHQNDSFILWCLVALLGLSTVTKDAAGQTTSTWNGAAVGSWHFGPWLNGVPGLSHNGVALFQGNSSYEVSFLQGYSAFTRIEVIGSDVKLDLNGASITTQPFFTLNGQPITTLIGWTSSTSSRLTITDGFWTNQGMIHFGHTGGATAYSEFIVGSGGVVSAPSIISAGTPNRVWIEDNGSLNIASTASGVNFSLNGGALYVPTGIYNFNGSRSGVVISDSTSSRFTATEVADDLPSFTVASGKNAVIHSTGMATLGNTTAISSGGSIISQNGLFLEHGSVLTGSGLISGSFVAEAGSSISTTGNIEFTSGNARIDGLLAIGNNEVKFSNQTLIGGSAVLSGGTLRNLSGQVTVNTGGTVFGQGLVDAKFSGSVGSTITANGGNLTIGKNVNNGFFHAGEIQTGANSITLLNNTRSTLGSQTSLGQTGGGAGTLNVANGAFLDFGRVITGYGTIDSINSAAKAMIINGDVLGDSTSRKITFNGYVKGVGTFENVVMNGTFAPGLSPTISYTNNLTLGSNSVLDIEIGGLIAGTEFDKLIDQGNLTLGGQLRISFLNGFSPLAGQSFDLLDWNLLTGSFGSFDFSQAVLSPGLSWDTSYLYSDGSLKIAAVPEPSSVMTCLVALFGMLILGRGRKADELEKIR